VLRVLTTLLGGPSVVRRETPNHVHQATCTLVAELPCLDILLVLIVTQVLKMVQFCVDFRLGYLRKWFHSNPYFFDDQGVLIVKDLADMGFEASTSLVSWLVGIVIH
jgi:hypothetical protein